MKRRVPSHLFIGGRYNYKKWYTTLSRSSKSTSNLPSSSSKLTIMWNSTSVFAPSLTQKASSRFISFSARTYIRSGWKIGMLFGCTVATAFMGFRIYAEEKKETSTGADKPNLWDTIKLWFTGNFAWLVNSGGKPWLPEPLPPPIGKEYTLIISDEVLSTSQYGTTKGFILKKRPGVEFILSIAALQFETVLFSMQPFMHMPVLDNIDPNRRCLIKLTKELLSVTESGQEIKDLSLCNRDLSKVLVIDTDYEKVSHKENVIIVSKYDGKDDDSGLIELEDFFRFISWAHPRDLRPFIQVYQQSGPAIFKEKYRKLKEMKKKERK